MAAPVNSDVVLQCYVEASPHAMNTWYKDPGEKLTDHIGFWRLFEKGLSVLENNFKDRYFRKYGTNLSF